MMQIREQPDGVFPAGDRGALHRRAGNPFESTANFCMRKHAESGIWLGFLLSCVGIGSSQKVEQQRSVHLKCCEFCSYIVV